MRLPPEVREGVMRRLQPLTPLVRGRMAEVVRHVQQHGASEIVFVGYSDSEHTLRVQSPNHAIIFAAEGAAYIRPWGSFPGEGALPEMFEEALRDLVLGWLAECWCAAGGFNLPLTSVRVIDATDPEDVHELWGRC